MGSGDEFDLDFRPKLGRTRDQGGRVPRTRAVVHPRGDPARSLSKAAIPRDWRGFSGASRQPRQNGRFNARGRGAKIVATFPREHGWSFDGDAGMRFRARRVIVKARVIKKRGAKSRAAYAHLRYLQRDGVIGENSGRLYSRFEDEADGCKFLDRSRDDRHQFQLIVAPEDSVELGDLKGFTRQVMAQAERDLQTKLDWVAVDHHNTGHPHTHVIIRGVTDEEKILYIAGDYIAHGIRYRAGEIVTLELGHQSEWEVRQKLAHEVDQDRFTPLDRAILQEVNADGRSICELKSIPILAGRTAI